MNRSESKSLQVDGAEIISIHRMQFITCVCSTVYTAQNKNKANNEAQL